MIHTFRSSALNIYVLVFFSLVVAPNCEKDTKEPESKIPGKLLAHYSFDTNAVDSSENKNHGELKFNAAIEKNGKFLGALKLDGSGDYVTLGRGVNLGNEFTLSCWINPATLNRSDAAILAKYETSRYGPYDFYLSYDKMGFWISDGRGSYVDIHSVGRVRKDVWTHITWTAKKNVLKMFINGVIDSEAAIPDMTKNTDEVTIGRQALLFDTGGRLEFKGLIDELRLYERELTPAEIARLALVK